MATNFTDGIGPLVLPLRMITQEAGEHMLGWNIPDEHQHLVQDHWRSYPAVSKYWHYGLACIYALLWFASITGNGIVIWIFSTSKSLRSPSNMFVINLALFDTMMALEMPMLVINSFHQRLVGYETGCIIYGILGSFSGIGGAITNAVIAFDRYKTISCPLDGRINKVQAILLCAFTWLWAIPFTLLPAFDVWGRFVPEGFLTTCSFDYLTDDMDIKVFVIAIFIWSYCIPMFFLCIFYWKLFGAVRLHEKMLREQAKKMNVKSLASNKEDAGKSVEIRIAKVAFTIFFLFVCAWTPYAFVTMNGAFGDRKRAMFWKQWYYKDDRLYYWLPREFVSPFLLPTGLVWKRWSILTPVATMVPAVCAKIVSCIDPWVYAINHPRYRAELEKRIPWLGVKEPNPDTVSTSSTATSQTQNPTAEA